jgi:hypothetical protein
MPIEKLNSNLYRIKELNVSLDGAGYYLSMNPSHCTACVMCISRERPIGIEDLNLSGEALKMLYGGHMLDFSEKGFVLQGITKHQITSVAQFRNFKLEPPAYVQVWGMDASHKGTTLYLPENPYDQMTLVPVDYNVKVGSGQINGVQVWALRIGMDQSGGYRDGDLLYQVDNHLPIPIPKSILNTEFPVRPTGGQIRVIPAEHVSNKYIQKK